MSETITSVTEQEAITQALQHYIKGAKTGKGDDMKPAFHKDATIYGYAGPDLFAGPIILLFDWCDENGPSTELAARIANIDVTGTVATVRIELDNLAGSRYTDMFTLLKVDDEWKIMNKVFHLHA